MVALRACTNLRLAAWHAGRREVPPAASGCRPSATCRACWGRAPVAHGPEPLQSLSSCQRPLPERQQPVPPLHRLRLVPRYRRRLLRALRIVFTATLRLAGRRCWPTSLGNNGLTLGREGDYINDKRGFPRLLHSGSCYSVNFSATTWCLAALLVLGPRRARRLTGVLLGGAPTVEERSGCARFLPDPLPACLGLPYVCPIVPCAPCGSSACGTMCTMPLPPLIFSCCAAARRISQLVCLVHRCSMSMLCCSGRSIFGYFVCCRRVCFVCVVACRRRAWRVGWLWLRVQRPLRVVNRFRYRCRLSSVVVRAVRAAYAGSVWSVERWMWCVVRGVGGMVYN
jgi:hypothetical protein